MTLIKQIQCRLNLSENSNSIVIQHDLCISSGLCDLNAYLLSVRGVNCIVEHFRDAKVPDIHNVLRQIPELRCDIARPDLLFLKVGTARIDPPPFSITPNLLTPYPVLPSS